MARKKWRNDYAAAAALAGMAFIVSPLGIEVLSGRYDLTFRIKAVSICFDLFLLSLIAALLLQARARQWAFSVVALTFPLAVLSGLELAAISIHLADRIAPLEDTSVLANYNRWPGYLMSDARRYEDNGLVLYRPWKGDGIFINDLGLRTAPPQPKTPGEWRIAIVGGSTVWGWRVLDADTLSENLQRALRSQGRPRVTVYNFGVEASLIAADLERVKNFREIYGIDQAIFYVGLNDCVFPYLSATGAAAPLIPIGGFELVKSAFRLSNAIFGGQAAPPEDWSRRVLPRLRQDSTLRNGIIAASDFCNSVPLRCDFVLQPSLFDRKQPAGRESRMRAAIAQASPGLDWAIAETYAGALEAGPPGHVFDLRGVLDQNTQPLFIDLAHVNEIGHRLIAERLAAEISVGGQ
jgi:lysophospholipase L1-like esterase